MSQMIISMAALFLSKQVDFTDPQNLLTLRILYAVSTMIQLSVALICYLKIKETVNRTQIVVPATAPATGHVTQTITEYDMAQIMTVFQRAVITEAEQEQIIPLRQPRAY